MTLLVVRVALSGILSGGRSTVLNEAKRLVEPWRKEHNHIRPHGAIGYLPAALEAPMVTVLT